MNDCIKWSCKSKIIKYLDDEHYDNNDPYEVLELKGNTALYDGLNLIWKLAAGLGNNTNNYFIDTNHAVLGVGNSSATALPSQTGLLGSLTSYKPMDNQTGLNYPIVENNVITFRAKFGSNDANFSWNEWGILNGDPSDDSQVRDTSTIIQLNRKVEPMGSKIAGSTWVLVCDITLNP